MSHRFPSLILLVLFCCVGCLRSKPPQTEAGVAAMSAEHRESHALLCGDLDARKCRDACPAEQLSPEAHARCLIDLRYAEDAEARDLALSLYESKRVLPAVSSHSQIEGYKGEYVPLLPAVPIGTQRHHLSWLDESLTEFEAFLAKVVANAPNEVTFDLHPRALLFFQTAQTRYPSAFVVNDSIAYNLNGPLHVNREEMHHTFFHELFHLNDNRRHWAETSSLRTVFESIVERCGDKHDCYEPFAPYSTTVSNGTYYPFDSRTRDVREYGAELALRYFLEHDAIFSNRSPLPPFKCATVENTQAWKLLAAEFFGGLDLTPSCESY